MFAQRMNPRTGEVEWVVVKADEPPHGMEDPFFSLENTIALSSYLDMLHDSQRNEAYDAAIRNTLSAGDLALEIGSGTGLLAMMCQRALEEKEGELGLRKSSNPKAESSFGVTTCECFPVMAELALRIIRANGMENRIKLVKRRSEDLEVGQGKDMEQLADVLVCEILDSKLLGEGMIPAVRDAKLRLLKEDAKIIPYQATVYAQVFEFQALSHYYDLQEYERRMNDGIYLSDLNLKSTSPWILHAENLEPELKPLSDPFEVFKFVFENLSCLENKSKEMHIRMISDGCPHVIVWWWDLQLDKDGQSFYSTCPFWKFSDNRTLTNQEKPIWKNHWRQCMTFLHLNKCRLSRNSFLRLSAFHDETCIYFCSDETNFEAKEFVEEKIYSGLPETKISCNDATFLQQHDTVFNKNYIDLVTFRPERFFSFFDSKKRDVYISIMDSIMDKTSGSHWVVVDDSIILSYLAMKMCKNYPNIRVTILSPGYRKFVMDDKLFKDERLDHVGDDNRVKILCQSAKDVNTEDLRCKEIDVLLAEPFYLCYEGLLPWMSLRYWYDVTCLKKLSPKSVNNSMYIFPSMAVLRAVVVSVPDVWRSRRNLKLVCGFDHSLANPILNPVHNSFQSTSEGSESFLEPHGLKTHGIVENEDEEAEEIGKNKIESEQRKLANLNSNKYDGDGVDMSYGKPIPFSANQCGEYEELSNHFTLMGFNLSQSPQNQRSKTNVSFKKNGTCHGLFLWLDWKCSHNPSLCLSTAPDPDCKRLNFLEQGVQFLRHPVRVSNPWFQKQAVESYEEGDHGVPFTSVDVITSFNSDQVDFEFKIGFQE